MENVIAISPWYRCDPMIPLAACRAGAIGILDLGFRNDISSIAAALNALARGAGETGRWGVRWDALELPSRSPSRLAEHLSGRVSVLILAGIGEKDLEAACEQGQRLAERVFLEVRDAATAEAAVRAGYHGLIVKGHEAGGRVGSHSSFVLLQQLHGKLSIPYWIQGGVALGSAAAAALAGASGVVLCEQLWATQEAPFSPRERAVWSELDGSETVVLGRDERLFRLFTRSGRDTLRKLEFAVAGEGDWETLLTRSWLEDDSDPVLAVGQDIAFTGSLGKRFGTVGRVVTAFAEGVGANLELARTQQPLAPDSPLAKRHGTRYPIAQGPMTRVSDVALFAKAVADGGGLPFLALSVMSGAQSRALLADTKAKMGGLPWGVGILGFMPLSLRNEQLEAIKEARPSFVLIAGGRPSQARDLEKLGLPSYLHVPSRALLQGFLKEGARKFIFEGSECGGHTGPRTSFILWQSAVDTLLTADIDDPEEVQVLFAGGVHDALSAAMVSILAAPLTARGMKVGVLMGTAYLFTTEATQTGAILKEFQYQALTCKATTLLQSGVGQFTRCAATPFCDEFNKTRRDLVLANKANEEILEALENLNIGRLRIASKGIVRKSAPDATYVKVDVDTQRREGLYMLGEVAVLRQATTSIADLHGEVSAGSMALLGDRVSPTLGIAPSKSGHCDVAIVGMACLLPGAPNIDQYWRNILDRVDAIREVNDERWRPEDYFDPNRSVPDKVYSKWGGFLDDVQFDPARYGIPPASLRSIEPMQLLALEVARQALEDAGFDRLPFPRERTATIFGVGGVQDLGAQYAFRTQLMHYLPKVEGLSPEVSARIVETLYEETPKWTEDTFPGILGNVVAGRVANRLNLGGSNYTVDAACGSSLAALDVGLSKLRLGDADVALVGAVDGTNNAFSFMAFSKTHALSPRGRCRPLDDSADGIAISEGVAALVLKRLSDAERDGDKIHAVIKGIGSSSDGRNRSLTAPHPQGQVSAVRRAYADAGVDPGTVELVEAHGTGTAVGDKSEIEALDLAFRDADMARQSCAVGSVKSMIGHAKVAAGLASIIKSTLALRQRVLPPTLGVEKPNSHVDFTQTPFYISAEARPWFESGKGHPRRCGVSAFGFGGTNFHAVLEEYAGDHRPSDALSLFPREVEIFNLARANRSEVEAAAEALLKRLENPEFIELAQLAWSVHLEEDKPSSNGRGRPCRLSVVAGSGQDLKRKLEWFVHEGKGGKAINNPQGVYYGEGAEAAGGVCFLFPGQGSQKVNMLRDLVIANPQVYGLFERADALLKDKLAQPLSRCIYPLPVFSDEERAHQQDALNATQVTQPALGVLDLAAFDILAKFGLAPDFVAGHSYGEYVALCVAGAISRDDLIRVSEARGRIAAEASKTAPGAMAAVSADAQTLRATIQRLGLAVSLANLNAPDQTIIAGSVPAIELAATLLVQANLRVKKLPVTAAFHSRSMAGASDLLALELANVAFHPPLIPVFSNTTAQRYPAEPLEVRTLLADHIAEPVRFVEQITNLYQAGARIFVEVGPGRVLTGLVERTLAGRSYGALSVDATERAGLTQLAHCLAQARALGLPVKFEPWFSNRRLKNISVDAVMEQARAKASPGPLIWRINGGRAVPWSFRSVKPAVVPARQDGGSALAAKAGAVKPQRDPKPQNPILPRSDTAMKHNSTNSNGFDPHPSMDVTAVGSILPQLQANMTLFMEWQREQQAVTQRFLMLQEQLVGAVLRGEVPVMAAPLTQAAISAAAPATSTPAVVQATLAVPPAPVLPRAVVSPAGAVPVQTRVVPIPAVPQAGKAETTPPKPAAPAGNGTGAASPVGQFQADLLQAVSDRTGYPVEMLDLDAHMEADLGIDSIKRIEIFSTLKDHHDLLEGRDEETVLDELANLKTLRRIVEWHETNRARARNEGGNSQKNFSPAVSG